MKHAISVVITICSLYCSIVHYRQCNLLQAFTPLNGRINRKPNWRHFTFPSSIVGAVYKWRFGLKNNHFTGATTIIKLNVYVNSVINIETVNNPISLLIFHHTLQASFTPSIVHLFFAFKHIFVSWTHFSSRFYIVPIVFPFYFSNV